MKKYLPIFALLALLFTGSSASAQVQDYASSYSSTNVYVSQSLRYTFTGLDATTDYAWTLLLMRKDRPTSVESLVQTIHCSGSTSCNIAFQLFELVPTSTYGPAKVIDNFGNTLGEHFLAPGVDIAPWATSQQNPADEKTVISDGARPLFDPTLGVNHNVLLFGVGESILTTVGDYTLLHYRTSVADYQDEFIQINVASAASDTQASFDVEEFVEYNRHVSNPALDSQNIHSFVVLNTDGVRPSFISQAQNAAFTGTYDNPHTLIMGAGAYNYARIDGAGAVKSYGESVWIVSTRTPDWTATVKNSVAINRGQVVTLNGVEVALWDAYPDITLLDCEAGDPIASCDTEDTTDYAFATSQDITFTAAGATIEGNTILWQRNATSWQFSQPLTLTNLYFEGGTYDIVPVVGIDERIEEIVVSSGVNKDTMFLVIFMVLTLLTYLAMFIAHMRNPILYVMIFLAYGVMFIFAGWFTTWISTIMGFLMVIVLIAMFKGRQVAA